jgi:hypothetical protein
MSTWCAECQHEHWREHKKECATLHAKAAAAASHSKDAEADEGVREGEGDRAVGGPFRLKPSRVLCVVYNIPILGGFTVRVRVASS